MYCCGSITPLNLINSLNHGFDRGNSLFQKLWDHLGKREKLDLWSTKCIVVNLCENFCFYFASATFKQIAEADDYHEQELELEVGGVARLPGH